jgi:hypothetical protein
LKAVLKKPEDSALYLHAVSCSGLIKPCPSLKYICQRLRDYLMGADGRFPRLIFIRFTQKLFFPFRSDSAAQLIADQS